MVMANRDSKYTMTIVDGPIQTVAEAGSAEEYDDEAFYLRRVMPTLHTFGPDCYIYEVDSPTNSAPIPIKVFIEEVRKRVASLGVLPPSDADSTEFEPKPKPKSKSKKSVVINDPKEQDVTPTPTPTQSSTPKQQQNGDPGIAPYVIGALLVGIVGFAIFVVIKSRMEENRDEE